MQTVIETKSLCKTYGRQKAVDHVELHVPQGSVYGFIGPNGAGKSTTMKMLLGLIHPTEGQVFLLGQEMTERNRLALLRQTGSLIETPSGYLHLTGQENLQVVADLKGVPRRDIARVLEIVDLTADRNRKVGQYSLGMKQRLGPRRYTGDARPDRQHARRHRGHRADLQPPAGRNGTDGRLCRHFASGAAAV